MKFSIITLGCKVNQYESEMMAELLCRAGYEQVSSHRQADICIVNSCTVTATGDAKNRKVLHRVRREKPDCIIVLCGCMPQAFPDDESLFCDADIVAGNTSRREIVSLIEEFVQSHERIIRIGEHARDEIFEPMQISGFESRTRAFMKIQDGCNRFCTYCIIPYARGRVRSKPLDSIAQEAADLAAAGYREIVLVGINLSAYGTDIGADLCEAVHAVCAVDGVDRVRLGSIEPEQMDERVLRTLAGEKKFCPHFHLSLQSGCDQTLTRMRRHYDTAEYRRIVSNIRQFFDNPSITTDVMVGFVGESDEDFAASVDFCDEIGFAQAHVFAYSRRKGTVADRMEGHIPESVKRERSAVMIEHTVTKERTFLRSQVGRTANVLLETVDHGVYEGYTENYTKVHVSSEDDLCGQILRVKITAAHDDYCDGELLR